MLSFEIFTVAIPLQENEKCKQQWHAPGNIHIYKDSHLHFFIINSTPKQRVRHVPPEKKTERLIKSLPRVKENSKTTTVVTTI